MDVPYRNLSTKSLYDIAGAGEITDGLHRISGSSNATDVLQCRRNTCRPSPKAKLGHMMQRGERYDLVAPSPDRQWCP